MDKFVELLVGFFIYLADKALQIVAPLAIVTLIAVIILYMTSSPSKKEQYKSWAITIVIACILIVSVRYIVPDIIAYFNK